ALAQHYGHQRSHRLDCRGYDAPGGCRAIPPRAFADHTPGCFHRGVAVLRPAPVREYILVARTCLDGARGRTTREFALRPATVRCSPTRRRNCAVPLRAAAPTQSARPCSWAAIEFDLTRSPHPNSAN